MPLVGGAILLTLAIALVLAVLPVKWAAMAVGAGRTGFWHSLLALLCASALYLLGSQLQHAGPVLAFLLAAAGFAGVLETSYPKGLAIAVLHGVFGLFTAMVVGLLFGLGVIVPLQLM